MAGEFIVFLLFGDSLGSLVEPSFEESREPFVQGLGESGKGDAGCCGEFWLLGVVQESELGDLASHFEELFAVEI